MSLFSHSNSIYLCNIFFLSSLFSLSSRSFISSLFLFSLSLLSLFFLFQYTDLITSICFVSDVNECLSNPCHHHGTCHNGIGRYSCTCPQGYTDNVCSAGMPYMIMFYTVNFKVKWQSSQPRRRWRCELVTPTHLHIKLNKARYNNDFFVGNQDQNIYKTFAINSTILFYSFSIYSSILCFRNQRMPQQSLSQSWYMP